MFEKQITAGMAWLDQHAPGWEQRISLFRLRLDHCMKCVLGQLTGDYRFVVKGEKGDQRLLPFIDDQVHAERLGFTAPALEDERGRTYHEWAILTNEWKTAILARRQPKPKGSRITVLRMPRFACDPIPLGV